MEDSRMKSAFRSALDRLGMLEGHENGLYAPLVKRSPMRVGDEVPPRIKDLLAKNHTCACTDSNIVYVDTDKAKDMFQQAREFASNGTDKEVDIYKAEDNFKTLLVHEYTHILMRHVDAGVKFVKANGDKNYPIFALACDIEANRGYGILPDSDLYQIAVTDKSYPECEGVEGLMNIYRVLKKNYGDEILNDYAEQRENMFGDEGDGENSDGEANGGEQSQGEGSEKGSNPNGGGSSSPTGSGEKRKRRKDALQKAVESMEQMREEIEQKMSTMTEEELNEDLDKFDEETGDGVIIDGVGTLPGSDKPNPYTVLKKQYNRDLAKRTEIAIDKLKGLVRGSQIKTRVKTYSRQSRKEGADGLLRKGVKNKKALAPRILVAMDSSGSMSSSSVTPIASAIGTLAKMLGKTSGSYICMHEGEVRHVRPLGKWEEVVRMYYPDGDNDFDEVLKKALELKVEVVIDVGDGFCGFYDRDLMKRAKAAGIKWVDVQVCGNKDSLEHIIHCDASRFEDDFIGREIIKVGD